MHKTERLILWTAAMLLIGALISGAADITAQGVLKITKGYIDTTRAVNATYSISSTPPAISSGTQTIETNAAEIVTQGDVATGGGGWSWFRNLSSNGNAIAVGVLDEGNTNFVEFARLADGEWAILPLGTNVVYARSYGTNAASCELEKIITAN